ncbi:methionine aminopeptidase [[Clostridium] sordellii]|uniref:methionyl aminopeptidase n=1 Tax=Paraclostridium sordellii TaxID=1505 RepID=UPI0005E77351|nr:methionyl aminopeptidase [Paeniclostridium sordellii]CEO07144.1 methionine aminopeptidase [[Clostridium] sordellii] [Paeniclostridium sordellii]CEP86792.1 methionine aminopeptidase [[Clostridium] sordellii] [Paeniclostridium sordellii]CEP97670.1 methionine aminopeptidase [[Clostridium] sordellii] [Paeniclostridium sordellii]
MNLNRNDDCWCKSGKKYKKCHMEFDEKLKELKKQGYEVPSHDIIKNKEQIDKIQESAKINNEVLDLVAKNIKAGMSTEDINKIVHEYTVSKGAIPAPLGYGGFPKSLCTSINSEICHGIPSEDVILKDGDIINIDVSTIYNGYYSDASRMFMIGNVSDKAKKLVEVTKECLEAGIKAVKPWGHIGDIGAAIQEHAEKNGYSVVRDFGGHGIGLQFHEDPFVFHYGAKNEGMILVPGMIFTIEPMINEGTYELYIDAENEWTAYTDDGLLSAQWEHMILVTEDGVEILSK